MIRDFICMVIPLSESYYANQQRPGARKRKLIQKVPMIREFICMIIPLSESYYANEQQGSPGARKRKLIQKCQ